MKRRELLTKVAAAGMAAALALAPVTSAVAATSSATNNNTATQNDLSDNDIIDMSKTGSLTIHKYDITAAEAAKEYTQGDREANGERDGYLESTLKDYAIQGVEFSYVKVGDIETFSYTPDGVASTIYVVYEIPDALASILGLSTTQALEPDDYVNGDANGYVDMEAEGVSTTCSNKSGYHHYTSTQIDNSMQDILEADDVAAKNALEAYLHTYNTIDDTTDDSTNFGSTASGKTTTNTDKKGIEAGVLTTDENGVASVDGLELGLYLVVETAVPEQVTETVNPFFASLPFTNTNGDGSNEYYADGNDNVTATPKVDGGTSWVYDLHVYPKNQSGNPTLDKSVRNAYSNTTAADKNGTVNSGDVYVSANDSSALVVYNDDTNAELPADTDDDAYVANRGGYTTDGTNAGEGGAGYSTDFEYRDTTTASAGDILDYIIVSKLPHITSSATYITEYSFTDILSDGLRYNEDAKIAFYDNAADANANNTAKAKLIWKVTAGEFDQKYATVSITDENTGKKYTNGSTQMDITMTEEGLKVINGVTKLGDLGGSKGTEDTTTIDGETLDNAYGLSDYYMVIYYTATVESDDTLVIGDNGNTNNVVLKWSRTSDGYYNLLDDENFVYAYSLDLTKQFSDGGDQYSEAEFKLYNQTDAYYVVAEQAADGVYYVTGKNVSKDDATTFIPTDDGSLVVYGLEADTYQITEIATANGYTLLENQIVVSIKATDREVIAAVAGVTGLDAAAVQNIVDNYHGGIVNEDGDQVDEATDKVSPTAVPGPTNETANGRTIGKTDKYVGEIVPATATVDNVAATMLTHEYTEGNSTEQNESKNAIVPLTIVNNKTFTLPKTGGLGTILFTLAGCAAAFAGIMVVTKKKDEKEEQAEA